MNIRIPNHGLHRIGKRAVKQGIPYRNTGIFAAVTAVRRTKRSINEATDHLILFIFQVTSKGTSLLYHPLK